MAQDWDGGIPLDFGDDMPQKKPHGTPQRGVATMQLTSPHGTSSSDSESAPRHEPRPRTGSIRVAPVDALMSAKKPKRVQGSRSKQMRPRAEATEAPPGLAKAKDLGPAFEPSVSEAAPQPQSPRRRRKQVTVTPWTAYYATAKQRDKLANWRQEWRTALGWGQPNARYFQPRNHILI